MPSFDISDDELQARFPEVPWRRSLPVTSLDDPQVQGLACRFCIARFGLKGCQIGRLPQSEDDFIRHMLQFHPTEADA